MLLARITGDMPIDQITRKDPHLFRVTALTLPPRLQQLPDQLLEQSIAEATTTISVTTSNNYVKSLTTFFSYAVREGYCSRNPFDGLRVRIRRKVSEERSAFSAEDLKALFNVTTYAPAHSPKPNQYWLPLMGFYTGARFNELCQLYTDDVLTIYGIACIRIRATRSDQKLKTASSERLVPLHSKLLALGLKRDCAERTKSIVRRYWKRGDDGSFTENVASMAEKIGESPVRLLEFVRKYSLTTLKDIICQICSEKIYRLVVVSEVCVSAAAVVLFVSKWEGRER